MFGFLLAVGGEVTPLTSPGEPNGRLLGASELL